jgi:protein phosphatase
MKAKRHLPAYDPGEGFCTHVGMVRSVNEDAALHANGNRRQDNALVNRLWAVADGMGGHQGGRLASRLACCGLRLYFEKAAGNATSQSVRGLDRRLTESVLRTDRLIRQKAAIRPSLAHMGTTLSCLLLSGGHSIIAHVGDSRIYRWREGHLSCLTTDHTFVQEMIFEGEVDPAQAHRHPLRHLLTNAVGTAEPLCQVDERIDRVRVGDRFLLCTDGLTNVLEPQHLAAAMARNRRPGEIAEELVGAALDRKTRDNVTALVVALL